MKQSRYTEEQVTYALRLAESGTPVADVCRQTGIAEATFYLWKKKFGSFGVPEVRELRQMREENARLKRLVADLTLDKQILQEVIRKKSETSSQTGAGPVGARPLPGELSTRVCARSDLSQYLVLHIAGTRRLGTPHAHPRDRAGAATIWLRAHLDHAPTRRLAG
jgi:putative transposase